MGDHGGRRSMLASFGEVKVGRGTSCQSDGVGCSGRGRGGRTFMKFRTSPGKRTQCGASKIEDKRRSLMKAWM